MATNKLEVLASATQRHASANMPVDTAIPGLHIAWFTAPTKLSSVIYDPCLCIIAQGAKELVLADESYRLDAGQFLLVSVDLPVDARVVEASPDIPYVGIRISLDSKVIGELLADGSAISPTGPPERGMAIHPLDPRLLDAVARLIELLDTPQDIGPLAPLILREITHRVLTGPQGFRLRQIAMSGAPSYRIARAIRWLRDHFADTLKVEMLAQEVGLSTSSFHLHFKNVTAMSPLQYQKRLRLQTARSLMLAERLDAADAALRVGYESPSQFSREYRRMFGAPPRQDVDAMLAEAS